MNRMNRSIFLIITVFILTSGILNAQEHRISNDRVIPELRRRSLVIDIEAKVLEGGHAVNEVPAVIWNETYQKTTIPGTPVSIRIEGSNLIVAVQFTPLIRRSGNILVAQVQLGINDPERGFSYHTSIQTIPFEFDETIYYFPLGHSNGTSSIEIILKVNPFREHSEAEINTSNEN